MPNDDPIPQVSKENIGLFEKIGSESANNAALALAKMTGLTVDVRAIRVSIVPVENVTNTINIPSDRTTTVILEIVGDCVGNAALLFSHEDALHLAALLQKEDTPHSILTEIDQSALKEVGNIITGAILSGISNALGISINESVPDLATDMVDATMEYVAASFAKKSKGAVAFELDFSMASEEIVGYFLLLLNKDSMEFLIEKVGEERESKTN
jgi:chemotaxis protein CheC